MRALPTVEHRTEKVRVHILATGLPEDIAREHLAEAIDRVVAERPGAVLVRESLETDSEDRVTRIWEQRHVGIGAFSTTSVVPVDVVHTVWTGKARAFVDPCPERRP